MPSRPLAAAVLVALALAACRNAEPCPTPLESCNGQCVDVQSDHRYCGGCDVSCRASERCFGGRCVLDTREACPVRTGGGFVVIGFPNGSAPSCAGQTVKLWVRQGPFLDDAVVYVGSTAVGRVPLLDVVAGSDCDGQWSWSANELTPAFVASGTVGGCDLCPSAVQANVTAAPRWCPSAARILAVDRRPPP